MTLALILALSPLACKGGPDPVDSAAGPTWHGDVAPIVRARCEGCHSDGQIAPFPLGSYEQVSILGEAVATSVEQRTMPPWLAGPDCNDYQGSRWMDDEEIATIRAWVDAGMPEGDPAEALDPFVPPTGGLEGATHTLSVPLPYAPDFEQGEDDYRCFVVDPGLTEDGYVTGFEIRPGDPEIVHHLILYLPASAQAAAQAASYDAADETPGYTCFGDARVDSSMLVAWAPGTLVEEYPEGTGIAVTAGTPVIIQMHYNDAGRPGATDATEVDLRVEPEVPQELFSFFWVNGNLNIPAGEEAHLQETTQRVSRYVGNLPGRLLLHEIGPHMHSIGAALNSTLVHPDGSETCLLDVPRWDFNWQLSYKFTEPVPMEMEDMVRLGCTYDSTERTETTRWGDGTGDEMCLTTMFVTFEPDAQ